jgi:hypothetical protein
LNAPAYILDTGAVTAFAHGGEAVGGLLADAGDGEYAVAIPLICVIEAYRLLDRSEQDLVSVLRRNPAVRVLVPHHDVFKSDDCPMIGDMAQRAGRLGAGNAAFLALVNAASVVTSRPDQIQSVLGEDWPLVEV